MPIASLDDFKSPKHLPLEREDLPECGKEVFVCIRPLSGIDLVELRNTYGTEASTDNVAFVFDVLRRAVCGEGGNPMFDSVEEAQENFGLPFKTLERLVKRALDLAGISNTEKN